MLTSPTSLKKYAAQTATRLAGAALVCCAALLTGCASGSIDNASLVNANASRTNARPDNIYVYDFETRADQVKLDGGVFQKLKRTISGSTADQQQAADAQAVREKVANEIVKQLQGMGLRAIRSSVPAPADQNVLIVQGSIDMIDAGSGTRRMLIGFGSGKSRVSSSVQILFKPAGGTAQPVQNFTATGDSGSMPGMAVPVGVGAAAGHVVTSAAVSGGMQGISETTKTDVSSDAKRLGDAVAKQIGQIGVSGGWLSSGQLKG